MGYQTIWEIEVSHAELGKYRHIKGTDKFVVEQKAKAQKIQWEIQWLRKLEQQENARLKAIAISKKEQVRIAAVNQKNSERAAIAKGKEEAARAKEAKAQSALDRTIAAQTHLTNLRGTLTHTLTVNDAIDWECLKDKSEFNDPQPTLTIPPKPQLEIPWAKPLPIPPPEKPVRVELNVEAPVLISPPPPEPSSPEYQPKFSFFERTIPFLKAKAIAHAKSQFDAANNEWRDLCSKMKENHEKDLLTHKDKLDKHAANWLESIRAWEKSVEANKAKNLQDEKAWQLKIEGAQTRFKVKTEEWIAQCEHLRASHETLLEKWEAKRAEFIALQQTANTDIDQCRERWLSGESGAVVDYCDMVLANSDYPDWISRNRDMEYDSQTRTLVLDYALPPPSMLPTLKDVQYVQSRDDFKETHLSEKEQTAFYDDFLYQITLRTVHELFEADLATVLDAIVFNGIVTALNKSSGHEETGCVLSLHVGKDEFLPINLAQIDPKACFKSLKGIAASQLVGLAPVPPVMTINRTDRRFVDAYAVANSLDNTCNLAAMHWEDFENLIREVFEKEFSGNGGEVRVTQASRDGGVDVVAFDPDPIRGGKIVIQAKRYTNTVGVSAVRDLYGTVMNEGATKGILVSTANFGPDAYEFSKGKPLTLLNGGNLLHLLERHGHRAHIDLKAAKALLL